ncbi:hypothetical protein NW759_014197 [Fusarium solani]|nr:hypothetical protein NW759_014197 [Fusarium solani]
MAIDDHGTLHPAVVACNAVAALYPTQVVKPSSSEFAAAQDSFWDSRQRERVPVCFFQPTNATQVKAALIEVVRAKSHFGIKGGGHSASKGSSSDDSFQFDLSNLSHVEISDDKQTVKVGPGVKWGPLFQTLEKHGVMAVGGRDFNVGVPGFIFGGGISYLSAPRGWGIDNLLSVDLVLANGDTVTADKSSHPGLFKALRGGGAHNFGIATSLTLRLYPYTGMWGGVHAIAESHFVDVFNEYDRYSHELIKDGKAHLIMDFTWRDNGPVVGLSMGYPEPVDNPPIFDGLRLVPSLFSTLRLDDCSSLATEVAEVTDSRGKRNTYWTLAMEYDIVLLKSVYELWARTTKPHASRFELTLDINHITPAMRNKAARESRGNLYGLEGANEPLTNIMLTIVWENEADDREVTALLKSLGSEIEALVEQHGKSVPFKYMNYGNEEQDVVASFGEENVSFLKQVASRYDPEGVFQTLQPGGFKLY